MHPIVPVLFVSSVCLLSATAATYYAAPGASSNGNGTQASPFNSLSAAIAAADAGDTILVTGTTYAINSDADTMLIPPGKDGLTIRYDSDGTGRLPVVVSDTYVVDGSRNSIVSNASENVTISGFAFSFGPTSIGKDKVASVKLIVTDAPYFTVDNCEFFCTGKPGWGGSGSVGVVFCGHDAPNTKGNATHLLVQNCYFHDLVGSRGDIARDPIAAYDDATIRNCVFENTWGVVLAANNGQFKNFTFVSNVVTVANFIQKNMSYHRLSNRNAASGALFHSAYRGMGGGAEIAFNVFIGNGDAECGIFNKFRFDGFKGNISFHHNTVRDFGYIWGYYDKDSSTSTKQTVLTLYDNILMLNVGGVLFRDEGYKNERINGPFFAKPGSFFRNNALTTPYTTFAGAATEDATFDPSDLLIADNIDLTAVPAFRNTTDRTSPNYYQLRTSDEPWVYLRAKADAMPAYIGAIEPFYVPMSTVIYFK